jgi:hypothetical protein
MFQSASVLSNGKGKGNGNGNGNGVRQGAYDLEGGKGVSSRPRLDDTGM